MQRRHIYKCLSSREGKREEESVKQKEDEHPRKKRRCQRDVARIDIEGKRDYGSIVT